MKNDPRLSRRRLALIGVGAVGMIGLALIAFWRGSPPSPIKEPSRDRVRSKTTDLDMAKLLEEVRRKKKEDIDRYARLSDEERIDEDKNLSPEEKKREKQKCQEFEDWLKESKAEHAQIFREMEALERAQDQEDAKILAKEKPKKANLRLVVETASVDLLPAQCLITNIHLINDDQETVLLRTELDSNGGYLKAYVKSPAAQDYIKVSLAICGCGDGPPTHSLNGGSRWSFQTDLPLNLGYDPLTNAVVLGEYRVRLELDIWDRDRVVADEFTVRIAAPTGDDETVQHQIFTSGLHGFLGSTVDDTLMSHLWPQPDKNLRNKDLMDRYEGLRQVLSKVEDLCLRFPNSRYAPDLRVGFARAVNGHLKVLALSPEAQVDLKRRLRVIAQTIMDRDGPKSWARAEILLVVASCTLRVEDLPFTRGDLISRFESLCPTDVRTQRREEEERNFLSGTTEDPLTEEEKKAIYEALDKMERGEQIEPK
jgi:hypothetical protein